ncbi:MAG: DUF4430 domain-containing protein [Candidatus Kaiserbacteria bacterium]|nr:DUF4430 domain-containing protein [Candidatus Kaiserbacteria bacterium]
MTKKLIPVALLVIIVVFGGLFLARPHTAPTSVSIATSKTASGAAPATTSMRTSVPAKKASQQAAHTNIAASTSSTPSAPAKAPAATQSASTDVRFTASHEGTVIDLMRQLKANGTLSYTESQYAGLGAFVESINGLANTGNKYWFLYVNGKSATVGASDAQVRAGDTVEWRYESAY